MKATIAVGEERLVSREGTIIPIGVGFDDGAIFMTYHVGRDAAFSPTGASRSDDAGRTWQRVDSPLHRVTACGQIDPGRALFADQYLLHAGGDDYLTFINETTDGGRTFTGVREARVTIPDLIGKPYTPRPKDDPDHFVEPEIPAFYHRITQKHGAVVGGHIDGPIRRLADGALAMSCYCLVKGNMTRRAEHEYTYVARRPDAGVADEGIENLLFSSLLLRSEDDGQSWQYASTIGKMQPNQPYDGGILYSEGFTETGLSQTADGDLLALMRHGSYHLIWSNRSTDGGRTWQGIEPLNHPGVFPQLQLMANGALAGCWGRPGMTVAFSVDGSGRRWDVATELMRDHEQSQKYAWPIAVGDDTVLVFYDRRKWNGDKRDYDEHGIYCRPVTLNIENAS